MSQPVVGKLQSRLILALVLAAIQGIGAGPEALLDTVYGEDLPPRPRRALSTLIWRLRRLLGESAIISDGHRYLLASSECRIDAVEFEDLLREGRALARARQDDDATAVLRRALALWGHEPAIASVSDGATTARLQELRIGAAEELAASEARRGHYAEAIEILEEIVARHPEREHSQAQLIENLLSIGDLTAARRVHAKTVRYLSEQGVEAGPAIAEIATRLTRPTPVPRPRHPETDPATAAPLPVLAGRQGDLDRVLSAVWHALDSTTPTGIVLCGEAGIGKSALVAAVMRQLASCDDPPTMVSLHCDPRRTLPYAPLIGLADATTNAQGENAPLATLLRASPTGHETARLADTEHIHTALRDLVRRMCGETGLVLVVEDVHWAPAESLNALGALLSGDMRIPLAVLVTTREPLPPHEFARPGDTVVNLTGLNRDAVADLIGVNTDDSRAAEVHRLTGGNPLYIQQLQHGAPDRPARDLQAAIATRLKPISTEVLDTLSLAAVLGDHVDVEVLASVSGPMRVSRPDCMDRLTEATRRGLLCEEDARKGRYRFVHALVRDHLYRRLSAARRTIAHAEIGRALTRLSLGRPRPADLLAHHYTRGWPETTTREVIRTLAAAAEAATAQLDFRQACLHYRRILDHLAMDPDAGDATEIARTLSHAGRSAAAAGDLDVAAEMYDAQKDIATRADLPLERVSAGLGRLQAYLHSPGGALVADELADALQVASERHLLQGAPELVGRALAAVQVYRPRRAEAMLRELTGAEPALHVVLRRAVWEHQGVQQQLTTAREIYADPDAEPVGAWLRLWVSEVAAGLRALDDPPQCRASVASADDTTRFDVMLWRITVANATGRADRATHMIERALAAPRHANTAETARRIASLYGQRTLIALAAGDADRVYTGDAGVPQRGWVSRHPIMRYVEAYLAARRGDDAQAPQLCEDLLEELADAAVPHSDLLVRLVLLTDACRYSHHREGMLACLDRLQAHQGHHAVFPFSQYWGSTDLAAGKIQLDLDDVDGAIVTLERSLTQHRCAHAVPFLQQTHDVLANALDRRGRASDATAATRHRLRSKRLGTVSARSATIPVEARQAV